MRECIILHEGEPPFLRELAEALRERYGLKTTLRPFYKHRTDFAPGTLLAVVASDASLGPWLAAVRNQKLDILIIPYEANPKAQEALGLPKDPIEALELLETGAPLRSLVLFQNEALLGRAALGPPEWVEECRRLTFLRLLRHIGSLRLFGFDLVAQQQRCESAALMMEIASEELSSAAEQNLCARVAASIYAPKSIIGLLLSLPRAKGVGLALAKQLSIEWQEEAVLRYNSKEAAGRRFDFFAAAPKAAIYAAPRGCHSGEPHSRLRCETLPDPQEAQLYIRRGLPLVPIAKEEEFAKLFTKIRESAKASGIYLFLFVISVVMATIGLFQDSAPTIIGAMILAPLMGPVVALAMGIVRFDAKLIKTATFTITLSLALGLAIAAALAAALPFSTVTQQIAIRTHPTLLDLAVAILSGLAAAFGYANEKVGASLAGVAIAVALVPPLGVAGIGLGWGDMGIFWGALLLVLANIVGIVFAAGVMFYLLGFASQKYISAALTIKLALLASIAFPLSVTTSYMLEQEKVYAMLRELLPKDAYTIRKIVPGDEKMRVYIELDEAYAKRIESAAKDGVEFVVILRKRIGE